MNDSARNEVPPTIHIGLLGYAFMGKSHSNGIRQINYMLADPPARAELTALCGRDEAALKAAARQFGARQTYTDWRDMLASGEIQLLDNGGPNDIHAEPCIAAAQQGIHLLCEKPLARTAAEALPMLEAARAAGVKHMTAYNYRFVPAVRQLRLLIDSGALGRIYHFRAAYLQDWLLPHMGTPRLWRMDAARAGSGALGDLAAHALDLARYLVGEIGAVSAQTRTFITERPLPDGSATAPVTVDDAVVSTLEFENGALGTVEATRFALGRKNGLRLEINGERGSLAFDLERLNEFQYLSLADDAAHQGFRTVLATEPSHPWLSDWWPPGHLLGWEHTFTHEIAHLLRCIQNDEPVAPIGADFVDGYRCAAICDAIQQSATTGRRVNVRYED